MNANRVSQGERARLGRSFPRPRGKRLRGARPRPPGQTGGAASGRKPHPSRLPVAGCESRPVASLFKPGQPASKFGTLAYRGRPAKVHISTMKPKTAYPALNEIVARNCRKKSLTRSDQVRPIISGSLRASAVILVLGGTEPVPIQLFQAIPT